MKSAKPKRLRATAAHLLWNEREQGHMRVFGSNVERGVQSLGLQGTITATRPARVSDRSITRDAGSVALTDFHSTQEFSAEVRPTNY